MYQDYLLKNKEGERMSIRIDSQAPERGILILLDREEKSGPFLNESDRKYPIVSLRQPPELCGIDESAFDPEKKDVWIMPYRDSFCQSLIQAVVESKIKTLLIAGGGMPWSQSPYAVYAPKLAVEEVFSDI